MGQSTTPMSVATSHSHAKIGRRSVTSTYPAVLAMNLVAPASTIHGGRVHMLKCLHISLNKMPDVFRGSAIAEKNDKAGLAPIVAHHFSGITTTLHSIEGTSHRLHF